MSLGKVAILTNQPTASRYLAKIRKHVRAIANHVRSGAATELHVYHDGGCSLLAGAGSCDCDPTLQVRR